MRHVPHQQERSIVALDPTLDDARRVRRLQSARHGEDCVRVAGTQEQLRCLPRPELAAVPDRVGSHAAGCCLEGQVLGRSATRP